MPRKRLSPLSGRAAPSPRKCSAVLCVFRGAAAVAALDYLPWHVPGLLLVAEGVDGASRAGQQFGQDANLEAVLAPAISDRLWSRILEVPLQLDGVSQWMLSPRSRTHEQLVTGVALANRV